jgi:hypothetical protein
MTEKNLELIWDLDFGIWIIRRYALGAMRFAF